MVTVTDNGAGITAATVTSLCDFTVLVSDKARYRGPARGAQGNAFKTLLGIPFALGVAEPVVIESTGVRHELRVTRDRIGDVVVAHETTASDRTVGTSVTVPLPADLDIRAGRWAYNAALVNPHADISVITRVTARRLDDEPVRYKSAGQAWSKWMPSMPSSPHWYDLPAFSTLVHSHIRAGAEVPLGGFIGEFDGLSGSAKQKAIRAVVPGVTHLSGLEDRDDLIASCTGRCSITAKPTQPERLGPVGEDHLRRMLNRYGVRDWYKSTEIIDDGMPWVIEVAVADTNEPGETWFGCNHSPSFGDPLGRPGWRRAMSTPRRGVVPHIADAIRASRPPRRRRPRDLCRARVHGQGQGHARRPGTRREGRDKALHVATKTLRKEAELRRKDARKAERAVERRALGSLRTGGPSRTPSPR